MNFRTFKIRRKFLMFNSNFNNPFSIFTLYSFVTQKFNFSNEFLFYLQTKLLIFLLILNFMQLVQLVMINYKLYFISIYLNLCINGFH